MIGHFIANNIVLTVILIGVFIWALSKGDFQWIKSLIFIVIFIFFIVAISTSVGDYVKGLVSDNISKPFLTFLDSVEEWPGKVMAGLGHDAEATQAKYIECLNAGIKEYNLILALKKRCPKGSDEGCLTKTLNEDHPDVVAYCSQKEHTAGFLANLWRGLVK